MDYSIPAHNVNRTFYLPQAAIVLFELSIANAGKRGQLYKKKELLLKHWGDNHRDKAEYDPIVIKIMGNFSKFKRVNSRQYKVDFAIIYDSIPRDNFEYVRENDLEGILTKLKSSDERGLVSGLFYNGNEDNLYEFLTKRSNENCNSRGLIAEQIIFYDLRQYHSEALLTNIFLSYGCRHYSHPTELDGLLVLKTEDEVLDALDFLDEKDHIKVY